MTAQLHLYFPFFDYFLSAFVLLFVVLSITVTCKAYNTYEVPDSHSLSDLVDALLQ